MFEANVLGTLTSVSINLNGTPVPGGTTGDTATTIRVEITAIVEVTTVPATITVTNDSFISITFPDLAPGSVVAALTILKLS
ncbi:hypothetical protein bsdcttw_34120 [Anaerocolumna chitinilytica]|uniref:Uncharacterized protein n=2 Tax=Anaerocolumna chitinilytica TaxID=1727145 RepID=A0A7I8DT12_9FIRM|nr:hypothetical protein bsdcttw_34120 [Anaerocolumna chitinilytica]